MFTTNNPDTIGSDNTLFRKSQQSQNPQSPQQYEKIDIVGPLPGADSNFYI